MRGKGREGKAMVMVMDECMNACRTGGMQESMGVVDRYMCSLTCFRA